MLRTLSWTLWAVIMAASLEQAVATKQIGFAVILPPLLVTAFGLARQRSWTAPTVWLLAYLAVAEWLLAVTTTSRDWLHSLSVVEIVIAATLGLIWSALWISFAWTSDRAIAAEGAVQAKQ